MGAQMKANWSGADDDGALRLRRLLPPGEPATVAEIVEELGLSERGPAPPTRPRVLLNMLATADGRATLSGRSGPISNPADRALFHGLRGAVDAVLVGARTARTERYGRIIPDESRRLERRRRGLGDEPLACIVTGRLELGKDVPLLSEPAARVVILTPSAATLAPSGAQVDYVRTGHAGRVDLPAALAELRGRLEVHTLLCEGGPHLALALLECGLVDELFLSISPKLAGGDPHGGDALRILAGHELEPSLELELRGALLGDSLLLLRYGVSALERVSRETTLRSSLAR